MKTITTIILIALSTIISTAQTYHIQAGFFGTGGQYVNEPVCSDIDISFGASLVVIDNNSNYPPNAANIQWYTNGGGCSGTIVHTGHPLFLSSIPSSTTTYYAKLQTGDCLSYTQIVESPVANPGSITGQTTVCQGETSITYTVSPIANATSYIWTKPSGTSGSSTTNSITINYGLSAQSGNVTVKGSNDLCGSGNTSSLAITVNPLPDDAGAISGQTTVCQGETSITYSVPTIANATSYDWTLPSGATGTSTTNSITVDYGTSASSGDITIKGNNSCGDGETSTLAITVIPLPDDAGAISGQTTVCQGETSITYSVPAIANATSYDWTLPSGANGTSTTNSIIVDYGNSASSGDITVKGNNSCGDGGTSTLAITVNPLPDDAGVITGQTTVCQGETSITYSVPAIANATSYDWTLPSGATGTSTTNSITVDYSASASSGDITVKGNNSCGDGVSSTLPIVVNTVPNDAGTITGQTSVCRGDNSITYSISPISNATSYNWALPNGFLGTSSTNSITVDIDQSATTGGIEVYGTNSCGNGNASIIAVSVSSYPASAGVITGQTTVCQGETSITYSVPVIANATSYDWTLPSGATGASTTNSITVDYGTSASSGDITVKGSNSCGDGASSSLPITVNPLPSNAGVISGQTTVCQGENSILYAVPSILNATTYNWTLPNGVSGSSSSNLITVDYELLATSGDITVHGTNSCGDGVSSSLAVVVNLLPDPVITFDGNTLMSDIAVGNQWYYEASAISGETNQSYIPTQNGYYYVFVTDNNGCQAFSDSINVMTVGVSDSEKDRQVSIFPNPVLDILTVQTEVADDYALDLYNAVGKLIDSSTFQGNIYRLPLAEFNSGFYILSVTSADGRRDVFRILKE